MRDRILQFGEGNFLRGFADDFIDRMNRQGIFDGGVIVVKPTPRGDLAAFQEQNCRYHLLIRGTERGETVSCLKEITCLQRAVNPYTDFDAYLSLAHLPDLRVILSNTTEAGICFDAAASPDDRPALSFPGKLTQLLFERYRSGLPGFLLFPCELIDRNGDELKNCVLRYADLWRLGEDFVSWIETENHFCNTLVDRIVTGFPKEEADRICKGDRLLDTAEPYHFWAIEGDHEAEFPLRKAGVHAVWTKDVSVYQKRKVRLLNGTHTAMVFPALLSGLETVGDGLKDPDVSRFLRHFLYRCALPCLEESEENALFADAVIERFSNPFLKHSLRSIALNSVSKFAVRILPTALEYREKFGFFPKAAALSLASLISFYRSDHPDDAEESIRRIRETSVEELLAGDLFGSGIGEMQTDVRAFLEEIEKGKLREAIKWAIL